MTKLLQLSLFFPNDFETGGIAFHGDFFCMLKCYVSRWEFGVLSDVFFCGGKMFGSIYSSADVEMKKRNSEECSNRYVINCISVYTFFLILSSYNNENTT